MESMISEKENSKNETKISRGRADYTAERTPTQRRLDSFARLLAAYSECVAVSIINGQLYITANELYTKTKKETKVFKSIEEISKYFEGFANDKKYSEEERKDMFVYICSTIRFKTTFPEGLAEKIAENIFEGKNPTVAEILNDYGNNSGLAGQLYGTFIKLYKDFSKLQEALKPGSTIISTETLNAFKKGAIILTEQKKQKIHAEVQMLDYLTGLVKKKQIINGDIYIGISKLRCLCCRCMLETANKIFNEENINIKVLTRGQHDFLFENWVSPDLFSAGYKDASSVETRESEKKKIKKDKEVSEKNTSVEPPKPPIEFRIGTESRVLMEDASKKAKESGISMEANESDSDSEALVKQRLEEQKQTLQNVLDTLKSLASSDKESIKIISIAINLYDVASFGAFVKLYENEKKLPIENKEIIRSIISILEELNKGRGVEEQVSFQILISILTNSQLVPKNLATHINSANINNVDILEIEQTKEKIELEKDKGKPILPLQQLKNKKDKNEEIEFVSQDKNNLKKSD